MEGMEAPNSASLGTMGSLLGKLDELLQAEDDGARSIRQLQDDVGSIRTKLVKLSEVHDPPLTVKYWMKDVRELSYDMEDCVDQFIHADGADAKFAWMEEISGFKARVDEVRERYDRYELESVLSRPTITNSLVSHHLRTVYGELEPVVPVGMDGPSSELLGWLKPNGDDGEEQLKVVSILGVNGVGKSTLAQKLWRELGGEFECRAFVQTAKKPDMRMILRSILSQVCPHQPPEACQVQNLIHDLKKHLQDKRYFIIIDDLWAVSVWDVVSRSFPEGNRCSRILTTTMIEDVALACCNYDPEHILKLEPLGANHSKQLFFSRVFGSGKGFPQQFYDFSDEITRKCGGLPLAIICIATLLSSHQETVQQWEFVQNFLFHSLKTNSTYAEILTQGLKLCYSNLPHCLKTCLLYLSVYPENYIILKEDLVNQWIAEGFICTMEGKDTVEVARSYFDELVSLGLIQQMNINCNKKGLSYAVHPIVFDYITCNSIEDNFITIIDYCQSTVLPNDKIRRLSLHFGSATYATTPSGIGLWQVRSLTFVGLLKCMPSMVEFKLLRVVTLHLWGDNGDASLPLTGICALFLLRYLQVRCNVTVELPDQMLGLKHLETLEINAKVSAVPSDIVHLPSLLHVILGGKRNHKHLTLGPVASGKAVSLDDSGSSTSSPLVFLQRFELLPPICIFPRLPEWIRRLRELRILEVVVRELRRGDLDVLAELPALTTLSLHVRTPTAVRIGRGAFPALECFKFLCGVLFLGFQEEAMPKLRRLKIGFNAYKGEKYDHMLADIEHLLNLQEIVARIGADTGAEESDRRAAESAFKDAIRMHPCHRSLKVKRVDRIDEGYDPSEEQNWSQQIESSNEQGVVLEIHLATQNEHLSIQQLEIMRKMPAQYMKKHADIGISRFYYLPEAHPSTRQKSGVAPIQLTFQLLEDITNRFSEEHKIGSGCYGETYKGVLPNGEEIAVKKLYHSQGLDNVQFGKEFKNLVRVQHPNVIRLVGYCETRRKHVEIDGEYGLGRIEERVLCFEYLQLGSLDKYLSDESSGLDWHTRYKIIKGTCEGLNYLHNGSKDPIYHLDLKPSNILLDENMVPKITDFSLSRLFSTTQTNTTKNIIGKLEYMPPEYIKKCQISTKFDVFSLGVTIIQIMAGPLGYSKCAEMSPQQFIELVHQNWRKRLQHKLQEADNLEVNTCIRLALKCVEDDQVKRPTIAEVLNKLNLIETVKTSLINQNTLEMEFVTAYGEATQYQIQEVIAKGSFGVVAAAVDTRTGDRVAIKKINYVFEHVSDATRTLREIKFLRLLRHPDIVEIKHIMLPPSRREFQDIYVVFELMDSDLHQVIKANDDLTPEHHQFFMYQLLRALKYIHAANVFHRDIKPKNILANANCKLKICDFGLARVPFNDAPSAIFWTDYVATRWYRAPELCGSFFSKYTTAIDIWSVGCIFAELLTGKPLFPGKNVVHQLDLITDLLGTPSYETLSQIRNEKARRYLRSMRKKHPVPFTQKFRNADPLALRLLERLLAFDPKDRPTAEEALADPYFACLSNVEREPSRHPISKLEFEFERKRLTKDDLRELIYREILEYHPQQLQEYVKGAEQISFLYPSGVDDVKRQFAHLEEHYSKGERGYPLQRKHASLPRERVLVSKDGNNEQRTDGEQRSADSIARTFVSPRRSQDMVNRRVKIMLRPSVGQKVVRSTNLSSQTYLKSASISASKFVVGDGNIYPEELRMVKSLRKCKERLTRSPCRDGPDLLRALCLN